MKSRHTSYLLAAAVALATFAVYLPSLGSDFVIWDDEQTIVNNVHIRSLNGDFFVWALSDLSFSLWQPTAWLSHALDYAIWGLDPAGHHFSSMLLHSVNTFLVVFAVIGLLEAGYGLHKSSLLASGMDGGSLLQRRKASILITAGVTGALFGLHPLHVEPALWITGRTDLISGLFFLLSVMSYVKYAAVRAQRNIDRVDPEATIPTDAGVRSRPLRYYLLSFAYFVLALSGKPAVVTAPAVFLLLDWYPFGRIRNWRDLVSTVLEKLPFAVVSIVLSLVTMASQKALVASDAWDRSFLAAQAMLSAEAFITYLWRILYPLHLLPFYPFPEDMTSLSFRALSLMVIGVSLTLTALFLARRRPVITVAWFFYLATILPTLGMVGIRSSFMADRYMYLPSLGPFIIVGMLAARPWNGSEAKESAHVAAKRIVLFAGAAIGIILLILTNQQISIWKNSVTLWSHVIAIEPNRIPIAYNNRGLAFKESGQRERALDDYEKALALFPSAKTYTNRGILYAEAGKMEKALDDLNKAIDLDVSYADAYTSRGLVYLHNEFPELAIKDFDRALQLKPESADAWLNKGLAYEQEGDLVQAAGDYTKAIELNPYDHLALAYRGAVFGKMGRYGEAVDDQTMSITLQPDFAAAYLERGNGYREMGKTSLALQDYQRACDLGADDGCMAMHALQDGK